MSNAKMKPIIRISRLAFIQGNSHYGRGNSPSQVKEMAEFEKWAIEEERELNETSAPGAKNT